MTFAFDNAQTKGPQAQLAAANVKGWIIVWGFFNFWIGQGKVNLEQKQNTPNSGSNTQARDGLYIQNSIQPNSNMSPLPAVLPWSGDVWILNGDGVLDNPTNMVFVQVMQSCP